MNEQKNNGRGVFYGVIGVATLVVAIIGATFAYFTATASNNNQITGNMATITFNLAVDKVTTADEVRGGMIPMSNSMVEAAIGRGKSDGAYTEDEINKIKETDPDTTLTTDDYKNEICVDDNGNAVCQIYKISVVNGGSAGMFLDGYVSLTGGSGVPTDITAASDLKNADSGTATTMRWAQAFCTGEDDHLTSCTTAGKTTTNTVTGGTGFNSNWAAIQKEETVSDDTSGKNTDQIVKTGTGVTAIGSISGNNYDIINQNYIRISDHDANVGTYYRTTDVTSALVFNQFIASSVGTTIDDDDDSNGVGGTTPYSDAQVFYIVVWLGETGKNQTAGADETNVPESAAGFFKGNVSFISAQGSEVTATFSGYTAVESDQKNQD